MRHYGFHLVEPPAPSDSDGDGIIDTEEASLGTNPNKADTDDDGLSDGDERTIATNPLEADTDSDGMLDGLEVSLGIDPLDQQSTFRVLSVEVDAANGDVTQSWPSVPERVYEVLASNDLAEWSAIPAAETTATGKESSATILRTDAASYQYFRISAKF